ncbi:LysM peptidoglycan-binding domain-containing protein [Paenibacillus sp. HN-1]|uniref:LysM peptidoglycan-binding domain-containing protein n=1 Tax=Paenibacillus TaxID=44249 RepID=UPI001CA84844|nr:MULTISPECIES: LysM peptidoglycan-binding domain-containing protein [Paenibacillus]MBY9079401.1 LysM peptidoglycan-binding domain-containing protein [Paenibacillus sp. CGMCC 1.18879]MBY9085696.1 LysM peptidoglycan-binding domain-containing protein [Paenibacillus sinensis]
MFDQSHGLRFDIYERIHLPQDLPGIAELEEIELLPDIQVTQREDRAELHGQLVLTGLYRSEDDITQQLEHSIPVEITVPLTRISSLDEIGVEIENFDIDLLTMRSLNVTGVLSLRGIEGGGNVPAWQREEYTVVYSPEEDEAREEEGRDQENPGDDSGKLYENSVWTFGEGATEDGEPEDHSFHGVAAAPEAVQEEPVLALSDEWGEGADAADGLSERETVQEPAKLPGTAGYAAAGSGEHLGKTATGSEWGRLGNAEKTESAENAAAESAEEAENKGDLAVIEDEPSTSVGDPEEEAVQTAIVTPEQSVLPEEKPNLKIALGSKKENVNKDSEHLTFSSLLPFGHRQDETEEQPEEKTAARVPDAEVEKSDDREWKSRFMRTQDSEAFRKVRLCIVQREETLDSIAEKYQLSTRELVLYNRLPGQTVEEGQVLYIP